MIFTPEEKQEIDAVLKGFRSYIEEHPDFDIVYSPKIGYLKLDVAKEMFQMPPVILRAEDMMEHLLDEIMLDEGLTDPSACFQSDEELEAAVLKDAERIRRRAAPFAAGIAGVN